jgi:hypothetical protein
LNASKLTVASKIHAAPIQPAEGKVALAGIFPNFKYPAILGSTCAGVVDAIGEGVTKVQVGDRVAAGLNNYANGGDPARASLQRFAIAEDFEVVPIGPTLSFPDAVARNTQTPAAALFRGLGMDYPTVDPPAQPQPKGKKILIWGGSSAMGSLSIGYGKRAGYEVIATASKHNFDLVKGLGADYVFDRSDPTVVDQVAQLLPIDFWFDTISLPDSLEKVIALAERQRKESGQTIRVLTLLPTSSMPGMPEIPEGIETQMFLFRGKAAENQAHVEWFLGKGGYLERGLKEGWIVGVPPEVIGGLDAVQQGVKDITAGVSGRKLVIDPWKE